MVRAGNSELLFCLGDGILLGLNAAPSIRGVEE
jgi:hypothetical protein